MWLLKLVRVRTGHTAQPNTSEHERWNTIQGYHSGALDQGPDGGTRTGAMMSANMLRRLDEAGRLTSSHKQLLGMALLPP